MIYRYRDIQKLRLEFRDKKVVFVTGCFDLLHRGHLDHLYNASNLGEIVIVGVLPDKYVRTFKRRKPVNSQLERARILDALKPVTHVILVPYVQGDPLLTGLKILRELRPTVFLHRGNNKVYETLKKEFLEIGVTLSDSSLRKVNSTSLLIKKAQTV